MHSNSPNRTLLTKQGLLSPSYRKGVDRNGCYAVLRNWDKASSFGTIYAFPIGRETKMAIWSRKGKTPATRYQRGRRWATGTLAFCGLFSMYANVRSGEIGLESVLWSAAPPTVLFLTVHVISYMSPKSRTRKALVWFGLGFVTLVAFGASGYHIVIQAMENGQPWYTAICYPFLLDIPSLMCAAVLVTKDRVAQNEGNGQTGPQQAIVPTPTITPTKTVAAKKATPAKTTKPAAKRATPAKTTKPSQTLPKANPLDDPFERDMLNA